MQLQFHKCYKNFRISQACICSCRSLWRLLLRGPAAGMFFPVPFQAMEMRPKIMEGFPDIIFARARRNVRPGWNRKKHPRRGTTQKQTPKAAAGANARFTKPPKFF